MGSTCNQVEDSEPIILIFDCISYGRQEIKTTKTLKLSQVKRELASRLGIPPEDIKEIKYMYEPLDQNRKIKELGLLSGCVLLVKFKEKS